MFQKTEWVIWEKFCHYQKLLVGAKICIVSADSDVWKRVVVKRRKYSHFHICHLCGKIHDETK